MGTKWATGSEGQPRELVPARTYIGALIGIFDIGTQPGYQGGQAENKFILQWELHTRGTRKRAQAVARNERGNPLTICQFVGLKLGTREMPSNLLKVIEATERATHDEEWIKTTRFDIETLLEESAVLVVAHRGEGDKAKAVVESLTPLEEDDEDPAIESNAYYFELTDAIIRTKDLPEWLPKFVAKFVAESGEWRALNGTSKAATPRPATATATVPAADDDDDGVPF